MSEDTTCPPLRSDIMDLFLEAPEPLDHLSFATDAMGIPFLIATLPADDRSDLGLDGHLPLYPTPDPSPGAVLERVARRMLKSMNLRRSKDDQLDDSDRVFPNFANPENLLCVDDFGAEIDILF